MTSAMLLEYEDNNVGEDESANDQRSKWRVKNEEMPKKLTVLGPWLGRFMFQGRGIGPPLTQFMQVRCDCASG
jgi:hypothetical protein